MTKEAEDKLREEADEYSTYAMSKQGFFDGAKSEAAREYWQSQQSKKADIDLFKLRNRYYDTDSNLTKGEIFEWFIPYLQIAKEELSDAVEFAEWARQSGYTYNGVRWRLPFSDYRYTGKEVYEKFTEFKNTNKKRG